MELEHSNQAMSASAAHLDSYFHETHHVLATNGNEIDWKHETEELKTILTAGENHLSNIIDGLRHDFDVAIADASTGRESLEHSGLVDELVSLSSETEHARDHCSSQIQLSLHSTEQAIHTLGVGLGAIEDRARAWVQHSAVLIQDLTVGMQHHYLDAWEGLATAASVHLEQRIPQQLDITRGILATSLSSLEEWTA